MPKKNPNRREPRKLPSSGEDSRELYPGSFTARDAAHDPRLALIMNRSYYDPDLECEVGLDDAKEADGWLARDSLELQPIVNIAFDRPIQARIKDAPELPILRELKTAIDSGELPADRHGNPGANVLTTVKRRDLCRFAIERAASNPQLWKPLLDFCERWAAARGEELPTPSEPDGAAPRPRGAPPKHTNARLSIERRLGAMLASRKPGHGKTWFLERNAGTIARTVEKDPKLKERFRKAGMAMPSNTTLRDYVKAWARIHKVALKQKRRAAIPLRRSR